MVGETCEDFRVLIAIIAHHVLDRQDLDKSTNFACPLHGPLEPHSGERQLHLDEHYHLTKCHLLIEAHEAVQPHLQGDKAEAWQGTCGGTKIHKGLQRTCTSMARAEEANNIRVVVLLAIL